MEQSVLIAIKSGLSLIEKCLRDILQETKPSSDSKNWLLRVRRSDLSNAAASKLTVKAEEMLKEIQELQRMFEIGKDTESTRWRVVSDLNQIWSTLTELSLDRLREYGQMQPEESKLLTAHVERMNAVRKEMEQVLSE
jgi:hypothetical protein